MCNEVVQAFLRYVLTEYNQLATASPEGWASVVIDMHQCVHAIKHEVQRDWKGVRLCRCSSAECKCKIQVGMLEIVQMHQLHFTLRDDVQTVYWSAYDSPADDTDYYHMDFLQHKALPMGPDESS
eukprot:1659503-Karenia_brevis.AAC.1